MTTSVINQSSSYLWGTATSSEWNITLDEPQNAQFSFHDDDQLLFTIKCDGTIERGPAFTTMDEMSLKFWEIIDKVYHPSRPVMMPDTREYLEAMSNGKIS